MESRALASCRCQQGRLLSGGVVAWGGGADGMPGCRGGELVTWQRSAHAAFVRLFALVSRGLGACSTFCAVREEWRRGRVASMGRHQCGERTRDGGVRVLVNALVVRIFLGALPARVVVRRLCFSCVCCSLALYHSPRPEQRCPPPSRRDQADSRRTCLVAAAPVASLLSLFSCSSLAPVLTMASSCWWLARRSALRWRGVGGVVNQPGGSRPSG